MRNFLSALLGLTLLLAASVTGYGIAAAGTGYGELSTTQDNSICEKLVVRINNTTKHTYSADFRFPSDGGTPDEYSDQVIEEGPLAGLKFGNRYGAVDVPPGGAEWYFDLKTFPELAGLEYRVARGPEQKVYFNWTQVDLKICETETTTTTPPTTTTTTSTTPPSETSTPPSETSTTSTTSGTSKPTLTSKPVYYADCDAVIAAGKAPIHEGTEGYAVRLDKDRDGIGCELEERAPVQNASHDNGDLASTGASNVGIAIGLGTLLLLGGSAAVAIAVRRYRRTDGAA